MTEVAEAGTEVVTVDREKKKGEEASPVSLPKEVTEVEVDTDSELTVGEETEVGKAGENGEREKPAPVLTQKISESQLDKDEVTEQKTELPKKGKPEEGEEPPPALVVRVSEVTEVTPETGVSGTTETKKVDD